MLIFCCCLKCLKQIVSFLSPTISQNFCSMLNVKFSNEVKQIFLIGKPLILLSKLVAVQNSYIPRTHNFCKEKWFNHLSFKPCLMHWTHFPHTTHQLCTQGSKLNTFDSPTSLDFSTGPCRSVVQQPNIKPRCTLIVYIARKNTWWVLFKVSKVPNERWHCTLQLRTTNSASSK